MARIRSVKTGLVRSLAALMVLGAVVALGPKDKDKDKGRSARGVPLRGRIGRLAHLDKQDSRAGRRREEGASSETPGVGEPCVVGVSLEGVGRRYVRGINSIPTRWGTILIRSVLYHKRLVEYGDLECDS